MGNIEPLTTAIEVVGVRKSFGSVTALERVDLRLDSGQFLALLGPSGCGKTTLLRIVAGLEHGDEGRVLIAGRDVTDLPPRARGIAMVFQNYAVFPHMTVRANIGFGLEMAGAMPQRISSQVAKAASLLKIEPLLNRYPAQLSGGQRQRVAVARALAVEPTVLLMDEPLSNLDALMRLEMRAELKSLLREAETTTLYVTHDQTEAMGLADRIALLDRGRILQIDTPTRLYDYPASRTVGGFVGSPPMNFLTVPRDAGGTPVVMGLRAEDFVPDADGMPFVVAVAEPMGSHTLLTGHIDGQRVRIVAEPNRDYPAGATIRFSPRPGRIRWFDAATDSALPDMP